MIIDEIGKNEQVIIAGNNKKLTWTEYRIGSGQWFIKDYFLYIQMAWTTLVIHVGDIKYDENKSLKLRIEIPK
jgi:hypothetical protein